MDRQDNLNNTALYNNTLSVCAQERKATVSAMENLEALRVSPDNKAGLGFVYHIIKLRALEELHVDLRTYHPAQAALDYTKADAKESDVAEILFQHAKPLKSCPFNFQLPLMRLVFWNVNLYRCAETWLRVIRAISFKEIELSGCPWAGNLLVALAMMHPFLEKVKIHHDVNLDDVSKAPDKKGHDPDFYKALTNIPWRTR